MHAPPEGECAARHDAPQLSDQSAEGSRAPAGVLRCLQSPSGTEKVGSHRKPAKSSIRTEHAVHFRNTKMHSYVILEHKTSLK